MGRLVRNHSTHVEGVMDVLGKLVRDPAIKTVTPGRLRPVKGTGCVLRMKVSIPVIGGWKLNVRKSRLAQEVFVVTDLDKHDLQTLVDELLQK